MLQGEVRSRRQSNNPDRYRRPGFIRVRLNGQRWEKIT